jgi:HAD superfamily hydrolase (TIGR01549 family)
MALRAVIFDLDDTLLDTSTLRDARDRRDWRYVLASLDQAAEFDVVEGESAVVTLPRAAKAMGLAVGVYTHSPEHYARELLKQYDIRTDALITGSDGYPVKPDPTGLVAMARSLGVQGSECAYVGDTVGDFGAAAGAGMVSIGVSWDGADQPSWRRAWPDYAVAAPSRLLEVLKDGRGLGPAAEEIASGADADWHWGSVLRLGDGTYGLGRYFSTTDRRHATHALTQLVIAAKDDGAAGERLAATFGGLVGALRAPDIVTAVPPAPGQRDRFVPVRAALASALGARDGGGLLVMREQVDGYKQLNHDVRRAVNEGRFEVTEQLTDDPEIVVVDDVVTSGGQSQACRAALRDHGAGSVWVIVASVTQDPLPQACPRCGAGEGGTVRVKTNSHSGQRFYGCTRWPQCDWSADL